MFIRTCTGTCTHTHTTHTLTLPAHTHPLTHPPTHTTHTHTYPPTHTGDPPFSSPAPIPGWTGTYIAREGERVQLDCPSSSSSSLLSLSHTHSLWMKKGGRVASNGMGVWQNGNGTLVLPNVTPEVGGTYWCVVWNEDYVAIETIILFING